MTIESVYHVDICNLDHATSRTLDSHFWPRRMTHYDLSDHIRISVVVLIPILHQLGISFMVYLIPHISPNYFQTNQWVQKKKRERCESKAQMRGAYQIWGPWKEKHTAPLWPLQRVPPHEEIWGHSTHPPPHWWTSSGQSVTMEKTCNQSEHTEKPGSGKKRSTNSALPFWQRMWSPCWYLELCVPHRRSLPSHIQRGCTPGLLCIQSLSVGFSERKSNTLVGIFKLWTKTEDQKQCHKTEHTSL